MHENSCGIYLLFLQDMNNAFLVYKNVMVYFHIYKTGKIIHSHFHKNFIQNVKELFNDYYVMNDLIS